MWWVRQRRWPGAGADAGVGADADAGAGRWGSSWR